MTGVVDAVTDFVGDVIDFAGDVFEVVGDVVSDVFDAVANVVEDVGNAIGDAVDAVGDVLSDLGDFAQVFAERYLIQAALMAVGIPPVYAAPMSAGMHTLAKGGTPEDALKASATVVVISQVGKTISTGMEAANADAIAQGGEAVYSATEIAAATSAAQSAIATAAAGGDLKDAVLGAAIGGVSGATATEVYNQTGSIEAANFTRVAMQASLQGVELEQAILMGASEAMVTYLQTMNETALKSTQVQNKRDAAIEAYKNRVDGYNEKLAAYKEAKANEYYYDSDGNYQLNATNYKLAQQYAKELNQELEIINNLSSQIGNYNKQIKKLSDSYTKQQAKAEAEAKKTNFDFESRVQAITEEEQQYRDALTEELLKQYADVEARRFGYEGIDIAGSLPFGIEESIKTAPYLDEQFSSWEEMSDGKLSRVHTTIDSNGETRQYNVVLDPETQEVTYRVPEYETEDNPLGEVNARPNYKNMGNFVPQPSPPAVLTAEQRAQGYYIDQDGSIRTPDGIMVISGTSGPLAPALEDIGEALGTKATLTEKELQKITQAAAATRGETLRGAAETYLFEQELVDLEKELKASRDAAAQEAIRADFVRQQRERLAKAQRLSGTARSQIDAELESILDEYEQSKGEAAEKAATKERIVASQQERAGTVSDEDVMRLLGLTTEEGQRYGLRPGGGGTGYSGVPSDVLQPPEEPLEGEMELGGGEGEGEPESMEQRFDERGVPITTVTTIRPDRQGQLLGGRRETPGIPSRVTGEALVGILGEKEPLFGGDEDEQRAVWNRRSLRLRKALGL